MPIGAAEVLPANWVDALQYGSLGGVAIFLVFIVGLARRDKISTGGMVLGVVAIIACSVVFLTTIIATRPERASEAKIQHQAEINTLNTTLNEHRAALATVCELATTKLNISKDDVALAISEQIKRVVGGVTACPPRVAK